MQAKFYGNASGFILRIERYAEDAARPFGDASQVVSTLGMDADTNTALLDDFTKNCDAYVLMSGVLLKNGTPVNIAADGPDELRRKARVALIQRIKAGTATAADMRLALLDLYRLLNNAVD